MEDPTSQCRGSEGLHEGKLEVGAIHPNQSPCCNAVMLVRKKDGGLCFCINFCKLNMRTKTDLYPLPNIQEAIESLIGAGHLSCLDLKVGFWQIAMDEVSKQYTAFMVGNLGFFECEKNAFRLAQCPCNLSEVNGELSKQIKLNILFNLHG